jgi:hypothetical protein
LQVADQVPVRLRQVGRLCCGFLDAVLRQVGQPQIDGRADALSRNRLRDRQELN